MIKILNVPSLYSSLYKVVDFCKEHSNEKIEIIVPDKLSLFMERFLFEQMNISASFNIKVSTLNRFAKKSCVVEKEKQISKVASIILIHNILNENIDKLNVLKNKAYSFSYAEDIYKTLSQFKSSKITSDEMLKFECKDAQLAGKIKDLALVYKEYEDKKAGFIDAADLFLMSVFSVAKGKENKKLLFVGFDDFTAIEYSIIEQLAMVAEVYVVNNYSSAGNKHIFNNEIYSQLKSIAYKTEIPFEFEECKIETDDLHTFLEENIYALKSNKFVMTNELVNIFAGNSVSNELEFVARDIRNKILNGQRYDDFGVAVFNLESNINKLEEIFKKYEINYYVDGDISIIKSLLYKFYLSVFRYNLEGYKLTHLIDIINSPFCCLLTEEKDALIKKLISINFRGKLNLDFNFELKEESKEYLLAFLNNLIFEKDIDTQSLVERLKNFDNQYDFDLIMSGLGYSVNDFVLISKSKEVLFNVFDDIIKFNQNININAFYDIFVGVANVVKISNLPLSIDAVKVVDANNTMEIFNDFYLVNATQENAPSYKNDCGIILDNEIDKLTFSHKLAPTIQHINRLSKLRLFNTLMLFKNEITVTYSNSKSEIVNELKNKLQLKTKIGIEDLEPIPETKHDKYIAMSKWDEIEFLTKYNKENIKIDESILKNKEIVELSKENLTLFNDLNTMSATALENYFKCPFYMFLNNILKVQPRLENEILSLDIGNVLHTILYDYYKKDKKVDDLYQFCKDEVFKCVEKEERLKLNAKSPILINLIDEAVRVVNAVNYIDDNSLFKPTYFEKSFGNETSLKLRNINILGKVDRIDIYNDTFRVIDYKSGKADASVKELYYGNKLQLFLYACAMENVLKKSMVGTFYLPLHNAYTKELGNTYALKGFYLAEDFVVKAFDKRLTADSKSDIVNVRISTKDKVIKTIGYKELEINSLKDLKNYSKAVAETAVDEIKSGYIKPTPSEVSKHCDYCPYVHICMKNSNSITYRKANKINLNSFKEESND